MPDIRPEFQAFRLNTHGARLASNVSEILSETLTKLEALMGGRQSRESSLVITHLQTAAFWARRGISLQSSNQEPATTTTSLPK